VHRADAPVDLPRGWSYRHVFDPMALAALALDPARDQLILVTCYPFRQWRAGGAQRFLVNARRGGARRGFRLAPGARTP